MARGPYLDFNASTPIAPEVRARMEGLLADGFGNPSSPHWAGQPARAALDRARGQVAHLLGAGPGEIVFTSGGTEASNTALKGLFFAHLRGREASRFHLVTTAVEHPATLAVGAFLSRLGARVTVLPVDALGQVQLPALDEALAAGAQVVSVMHANNETGTLQPVGEVARRARAAGAKVHVDAAQSVGKVPVQVDSLGADLLSLAGHKLYAPKGVGALYIRAGVELEPLLHGGGHEGGRRAGTESALLAAALGEACVLAEQALSGADRIRALRDRLHRGLVELLGSGVRLHGHPTERLPNTLNVGFVGRVGADLLASLDGVAASTGSACHAGSVHLSPVLAAMRVPEDSGMGAVRFSLGRETTPAEIDEVLARVRAALGARG